MLAPNYSRYISRITSTACEPERYATASVPECNSLIQKNIRPVVIASVEAQSGGAAHGRTNSRNPPCHAHARIDQHIAGAGNIGEMFMAVFAWRIKPDFSRQRVGIDLATGISLAQILSCFKYHSLLLRGKDIFDKLVRVPLKIDLAAVREVRGKYSACGSAARRSGKFLRVLRCEKTASAPRRLNLFARMLDSA